MSRCTATVFNLKVLSSLPPLHLQNSYSSLYSTLFSSASALASGPTTSRVPNTITPIASSREVSPSKKSTLLARAALKITCGWQGSPQLVRKPFVSPVGCRSESFSLRASPSRNRNLFFVKPVPKCLLHHGFFGEYIRPLLVNSTSSLQRLTTWEVRLEFSAPFQAALTDPRTGRYKSNFVVSQGVESSVCPFSTSSCNLLTAADSSHWTPTPPFSSHLPMST